MGILDVFNNPMNQQIMSAGLLDIGSAYGGGSGSANMLALQKRQEQMKLAQMEILEQKRQEALERERREEIAQAFMVPGQTVQTGFPLRDDRDMFYDTSEYDSNPAAQQEINSLLGNYNEYETPARAPVTEQEILQGVSRAASTGGFDPADFQKMVNSLLTGAAPNSYAPGSTIEKPMTGETFQAPTTYAQDMAAGKPVEGTLTTKDRWGMTKDLYSQTTRDNDAFAQTKFQWDAIQNAAEGGAGDLILTIGLNKMLDPNSVVRGEEAEAAAKVAGTLSGYMNILRNFKEGDILPDEARKQIKSAAKTLYEIRLEQYKRNYKATMDMTNKYNLTPSEVFRGAFDPTAVNGKKQRPAITPEQAAAELARRRGGQ